MATSKSKTQKQIDKDVERGWPSKARKEAKEVHRKAKKAVERVKKSKKQSYYGPKPPKKGAK